MVWVGEWAIVPWGATLHNIDRCKRDRIAPLHPPSIRINNAIQIRINNAIQIRIVDLEVPLIVFSSQILYQLSEQFFEEFLIIVKGKLLEFPFLLLRESRKYKNFPSYLLA